MQNKTIVGIGDLHFPFHSKGALKKCLEFISLTKPYAAVGMGDTFDMVSHSKFPSRKFILPQDEIEMGYDLAENFFNEIKKRSPKTKVFLIKGNHDERPFKRVLEKYPELIDSFQMKRTFDSIGDMWTFKNVETMHDPREVLTINKINFVHGYLSRLGDHLKALDFQNVVRAHSHTGGVYFHRLATGEIRWELDCGYLANPFSTALSYRAYRRFFKWTHGLGVIDEYGPRFIPFGSCK